MDLIPTKSCAANVPPSRSDVAPPNDRSSWRWAVMHFPCLEDVTPGGRIVMVSDRKHIPEVRREFPDLVVWHEKELSMFGGLMDTDGLDLGMFAAINRLKLRTRGWFMGVGEDAARMAGLVAEDAE